MEKLKDFIYEHSDLFFTTVIVIVVGVVVSSSLYGWFNIKDNENKYKEMNEVIQEEQIPDQDTPTQQPATPAQPSNDNPAAAIKNIEVASGSSSASISLALEKQGLIKSSDEFLNLLVSSGKETKLKAGTFAITQGSTDSQIIDILTK